MKRLNWGMIGGGKGSQIGPAHRIAAGLDGYFSFAAGALDAILRRARPLRWSWGSRRTAPMATGRRCWR